MAEIKKFIPCHQRGGPPVCPLVAGEIVNSGNVPGGEICTFQILFNAKQFLEEQNPPASLPDDLKGKY